PAGTTSQRGIYAGSVNPYIPITKSENETIAAYIYFDGRVKEEVATLLRPGEETWVNSRWVQVPETEGGGLAEREFLFREVGLERWLNGLDLDGHDAAAKLEKRRQKFEKRRRRKREQTGSDDDLADAMTSSTRKASGPRSVMRYGADQSSPVEKLSDDEDDFSSDSDDDDDLPEAAGQIKVAMFRVLASGEIKRGEYSPQFDAHDDDEGKDGNGDGGDIDHTTSFAKPKTLDPKSISTQTVTGIDGPEKPFAVFTFFYRGERQLQKMGILKPKQPKGATGSTKRRSTQLDFSNLAPLKSGGTVGFSSFRDTDGTTRRNKSRKKSNGSVGAMEEDSDEEDEDTEIVGKMEDVEDKDVKTLLSPEDAKFSGELADGLKRQHSAEPLNANSRRSPGSIGTTSLGATPPADLDQPSTSNQTLSNSVFGTGLPDDSIVASPLKKHRASLYDMDNETMQKRLGMGLTSGGDVLAAAEAGHTPLPEPAMKAEDEDVL
ncbi:hypothetical protein LSUE1_G009896, partial [Lachnellula suecica]